MRGCAPLRLFVGLLLWALCGAPGASSLSGGRGKKQIGKRGHMSSADNDALPALLALPSPEDVKKAIELDCSTGQAVTLDALGPVVVNTDGTLSRITNWESMEDSERDVVKRRICKRNVRKATS